MVDFPCAVKAMGGIGNQNVIRLTGMCLKACVFTGLLSPPDWSMVRRRSHRGFVVHPNPLRVGMQDLFYGF